MPTARPPECADATLLDDPTGERLLLVTCVDQLRGQETEQIWGWDGTSWHAVAADGPPPVVVTGAALDTDRGTVVRYGGLPLDSNTCMPDTWEWDRTAGAEVATGDTTRPSACDHMQLAYDSTRQVTLLAGGGQLQELSTETWSWDGSAWTMVSDEGPAPRAHHGFVFDAAHQQALLYGGFNGTAVFDDFWSWDGSAWEEIRFPGPGPRSHAGIAVSPDALLLFGGATGTSTFSTLTDETWLLTGGSWRQLDADGPSRRGSPAMAWDPREQVWVLYGGFGPDGAEVGDTWVLDGTEWRCVDRC